MRRLLSIISWLTLLVILLPLNSCQPSSHYPTSPWTTADLRYLDPVDESVSASTDILALYTRFFGSDLEIRLDMLDLSLVPGYDLRLRLSSLPGSNPWEVTIDVPARGRPTVMPANVNIIPRIVRDPWLDTITVRLNRMYVPEIYQLQVQTFLAGEHVPSDETPIVRSDGPPPTTRAATVIAFTDTFPAATPAQALRRWDGAHTGPTGERHGLKHILDNARLYNIPIILLDLKTPTNLAALSFLGVTGDLLQMEKDDLLLLPEVAYAQPEDSALEFSSQAARDFGFPPSRFLYDASGTWLPGSRYQFLPLPDPTHVSRSGTSRLIPLPIPGADPQATMDGPSLEVRRILVNAALSADPANLVVLGGSLPESTWGDSDMAAATFAWLAAHPWVDVLDESDLRRFPTSGEYQPPSLSPASTNAYLSALQTAPENKITDSAWQTYLMLSEPTSNEALHSLRQNYIGQVGTLLASSAWAEEPFTRFNCSVDYDQDLQPECFLANGSYFAVIETDGARLTHLFHGEDQLVGPMAQFTVGMSDPSGWNKQAGDAADPGQIMGAFSDGTQTYQPYNISWLAGDTLRLTSADGSRIKTFRLGEDGIVVTYHIQEPMETRIPLVVDPTCFFSSPCEYRAQLTPDSWTWGPVGGIQARVHTDAKFLAQGFTVSIPLLGLPEDPDYQYPPGHYYPFPLSVVIIHSGGSFSVQIGMP
jgi:hypothetical protein